MGLALNEHGTADSTRTSRHVGFEPRALPEVFLLSVSRPISASGTKHTWCRGVPFGQSLFAGKDAPSRSLASFRADPMRLIPNGLDATVVTARSGGGTSTLMTASGLVGHSLDHGRY